MESYKLEEHFPGLEEVMTKDGMKKLPEVIEGYKFFAIYFAASWCPPSKHFTPLLKSFYEEVNKDGAQNI